MRSVFSVVHDIAGKYMGEIHVGDVYTDNLRPHIKAVLVDYDGQEFEANVHNSITCTTTKAVISNFEEFLNNWTIYHQSASRTPSGWIPPVSKISTNIAQGFADALAKGAIDMIGSPLGMSLNLPNKPITLCECGAHKLGVKNYSRQHSSWCPAYKE